MAFNTILLMIFDSIKPKVEPSAASPPLAAAAVAAASSPSSPSLTQAESVDQFGVERDREILREWFENYIDEYKSRAFKSAFLEPAKLYWNQCGNQTLVGDVEVHSSNVFAAILLSCLGVLLPIQPYFLDSRYATPFLQATALHPAYACMLLPENFGRSWEAIPEVRRLAAASYCSHSSDAPFHGNNPQEIANNALNASTADRQLYSAYLARFTHFFTKQFFLEKALLEVMDPNDGQPTVINRLFQKFLGDRAIADPSDYKDIRHWVYTEDDDLNYHFQPDRCMDLLAWMGSSLFVLPQVGSAAPNDQVESASTSTSLLPHEPQPKKSRTVAYQRANDTKVGRRLFSRAMLTSSRELLFQEELEVLKELGIIQDEDRILGALEEANGSVDRAIEILLDA